MTIYLPELSIDDYSFPDCTEALEDPNGLLAFGGDLSPGRIYAAYQHGIFPWYGPGEPILWWSPSPRATFDPCAFQPSKSLKKFQRKHQYTVTINHATAEVIRLCSDTRSKDECWLNSDMQNAYIALSQENKVHSVEVWHEGRLIGGLYGVQVGVIFCGESMFSLETNASKVALWYFCHHFRQHGGKLIDCQVMNPHLASLGAQELSQESFLNQLGTLKTQTVMDRCFVRRTLACETKPNDAKANA